MMASEYVVPSHPLFSPDFTPFRERLRQNADLSKTNWFRVGGPAEWLFRPESTNDLASFLALLPREIPVTILGVGSNVIIRDGGIDGVVIKLGRGFTGLSHEQDTVVAGAASLAVNVALYASDNDIAALEFLSGIPGTLGGVVRMNGGAYGSDLSQVFLEAEIVERSGKVRRVSYMDMKFDYRTTQLPEGAIVTSAVLAGKKGNRDTIAREIQEISLKREQTQPIRAKTGGSTFKNPEGKKAWELVDQAGCRGLTIGGAQMSEKHCNFMINTGSATAADLENLGEEVRKRVQEKTGILLEWEIKRIGKPTGEQ